MTPSGKLCHRLWAYCAYALLCGIFLGITSVRADEYDTLRQKWFDTIVGAGYDINDPSNASKLTSIANAANTQWTNMNKSPTRTYLWSDAASTTTSSHLTTCFSRLRAMALAYAAPGCSLQGNASLLADIQSGLDWMYTNRYNPSKSIYDNWWDFEIGSPLQIGDITVLLYDQLTATQMAHLTDSVEKFTPSATTQAAGGTTGTFTGANRMWKIRVVAVRGVVVKNSAKLAAARDAFSQLFQYVSSGDGFYTDGSFIQHTYFPYTAGYGASLLSNIAPVMNLLAGSTWEVTDPDKANLFRWVFDSFEPIIYNGAALDLVRGRESGRSGATPQGTGQSIMDSILQVAQFAPPEDSLRMKSMLKEWALSDTIRDFVSGRGLPTLKLAQDVMNDDSIPRRGELVTHYTFPEMDRVVHLGKGYCFGLSLCSTRIANFESINGENLHGWFTGDGMTILYNTDLNQYADNYWATIDAYRVPGVTADVTKSKLPHQSASIGPRAQGQATRSPYPWVGGATLGKYGAAGMQFQGVGVTLTGKKSWFMFDDEIVCLGAGITSTDSRPIETTIENRKLSSSGANAFTVNGTKLPSNLGWTNTLNNTLWAHLEGFVGNDDIGYYFLQPSTITAVREARTGATSDIDDGGSTTPITRNYLRMTFEHGSNPSGATYQYVLLPGRSARNTQTYAEHPQVTVLANDANAQGVSESTLGITAANFWTDITQTVGGITVNKKCSVLVQEDGAFIDVSISDPTQLNTGSISLQINKTGSLVSADPNITVTQTSPTIAVTINVNGSNGRTFKARFYRGTPQLQSITAEADAYTYDATASKDSNFGTASSLVVKKSGAGFNREAYLRFNVPSYSGILLGASLNLSCLTVSTPGVHAAYLVPDSNWSESTVTWNNPPTAVGSALATWTPTASTTTSLDILSVITNTGPVSFKVAATTTTSDGYVTYASRENGTTASRPQLVLALGHTPPDISLTSPADGDYHPHEGSFTVSADVLATDGAITNVKFYNNGTNLIGTATSSPYSLAINFTGGNHAITAVATDANGLSRTSLVHHVDIAYAPTASGTSQTTQKDTAIDIDLLTLATDVETAAGQLVFSVSGAQHGTIALLADGHTARFTPATGYSGPAQFTYSVKDKSYDERIMVHYDFAAGDLADATGQNREAALNLMGNGTATYSSDIPGIFAPQSVQSIVLTENGLAGAARFDRYFTTTELDFKNADWSITGWFKRGSTANMDIFVQLGESGGYASNAMSLGFYSSANTLYLRNYNGSVLDVDISKSNVSANVWHHFAIVRNGTTLSLYLDGSLVGSDSDFTFTLDNSKPLHFGGVTTGSTFWDRWWNGSLADLAMFNVPLNTGEVTQLYTKPTGYFAGQTASNDISITVLSPQESWRIEHFGSASNNDSGDDDGDGLTNLQEYVMGTDPKSADMPPITPALASGMIQFSFTAIRAEGTAYSGLTRRYTLECTTDLLTSPEWVTLSGYIDITGNNQTVTVSLPADGVQRYYRLKVSLGE